MPDREPGAEAHLRREYHGQTARIRWRELELHYARGRMVVVAPELDLVEVAVQLGMDNTACFQDWIGAGSVAQVSAGQASDWHASNAELWAVVAAPWVLVQQRDA